jgi:IS30 family transposase
MLKKKLKPYLEDLRTKKVTNRAIAKLLNVSETHLSRVLKTLITKETGQTYKDLREQQRILAQARKEFRLKVAKTLPTKEAAKVANCSTRTIARWKKR